MNLRINGEDRSFAGIATFAELVAALDLAGKRIAIERNGEIVPRGSFAALSLIVRDGKDKQLASFDFRFDRRRWTLPAPKSSPRRYGA
ncbi:sulfur carrier protein ThiS [Chromobacterium phragmitis]|uniref:sulfur carrier protein ThiS n=1 Tax=Chromobacterium phragmitis TaxID=2202141 RepID=UPI003D3602C8